MPPRSNPSPRAVQWLNAQASRGKPALDSYLGFQTVIATDIQYVNQEMLRLTAPEDVQASSSHLTEQHAVDEFGSPLDRAYDSPEPMPGQATVPFSGHPGCQTQSSLRLRDTLVFLSDHAIAAGFKKRPKSFEKLDRAMVDTVEVLFQLAQVLSFIQVGAERGAQWTSVRRKSGNYPGIKDIRAVHRQLNAGTSRLRANIESALAKIGNQLGMDRLRHQRGNGRAADLRIDRSILSSASASVFRDYTSAGGAATLTYAAGVATRGHWASVPAAVASGVTTGTNLYTLRDQGNRVRMAEEQGASDREQNASQHIVYLLEVVGNILWPLTKIEAAAAGEAAELGDLSLEDLLRLMNTLNAEVKTLIPITEHWGLTR